MSSPPAQRPTEAPAQPATDTAPASANQRTALSVSNSSRLCVEQARTPPLSPNAANPGAATHPMSANLKGISPSSSLTGAASAVHSPSPGSASAGWAAPTHISHSVAASVVRNALPLEGAPGSNNSVVNVSASVAEEENPTAEMSHAETEELASMPAPPGWTEYSRQRAVEKFKKARELVLEHLKAQNSSNDLNSESSDKNHRHHHRPNSNGSSSRADFSKKGATASLRPSTITTGTASVTIGPATSPDHKSDGGDLYRVIRAAMKDADGIDSAEKSPRAELRHAGDWRDDDDAVESPSAFFHSAASLESTSNRVMEAIIAKGHAATTDEEMRWLYRHSNLLNLLNSEDLNRVVADTLRREYTSGETIANHDTLVRHLYIVVWGDVEVFQATSLGREQRELRSAFRTTASIDTRAVAQRLQQQPSCGATANSYDLIALGEGDWTQNRSRASSEPAAVAGVEDDTIYTHVATLLPGQVFGTESFVFDQNNQFVFRAGGSTSKTVVSLIPFDTLNAILASNPRFAQGVGSAIAGSVDVFGPIRQFCRYVFSAQTSQNEYLPLWSILESYTKINNVIHTKLFSLELDTGAWGYALNRLPENVTSTFCFNLVHALPPFVASRMRVEAYAADVSKNPQETSRRARTSVAYIRTKERRRCTWHLGMEGKDIVLLRDGFTDLLDFLTMLCVHIVESNKLRGRVQGMVHPPAIDLLDDYLRTREEEIAECKEVARDAEMARIRGVLDRMPLTTDEKNGLVRNWGDQTLLKIYEVMMHREEYNIRVDPSNSRKFQTNPFLEWALNLRGCVLEKLGYDRTHALPDDVFIDVVSSNTHCIKNLLCSFNRKYRKEILDYAIRREGKKLGKPEEWHIVEDMMYVATSGFLRDERPDLKEEFQRLLEENGITVLHDTAMTGLQVDVIPVHLLNLHTIDETIEASLEQYFQPTLDDESTEGESGPSFRSAPTWAQVCKPIFANPKASSRGASGRASMSASQMECGATGNSNGCASPTAGSGGSACAPHYRLRRHFIINMDFAFGAQSEGICRAIFSAFGKRIRSVSVMGKAGGLRGKRGDIQLASHVLLSKSSLILEDNQDELRNCRNQDLTKERLQELAGPRVQVHHGKVLTVTGTMLQNAALLKYYRNVWRCVGTEMEGSYFARVIEDFYRQGIAHPNLTTRFAYYTSDLPLAQSDAEEEARRGKRVSMSTATLSASMTPQEGVPPLYAIARGILENILLT